MKIKLDHFYGNNSEGQTVDLGPVNQQIAAIDNRLTNLSNITVKNNLANQSIPQQRINQAPTNEEHIIRFADIRYVNAIQHSGNWTGEESFTLSSGIISVNNAYECIGQVIVGGDDMCFNCGLVIGTNNNYPHSTTIYLTVGDQAQETLILRMRYQNNKLWIRRLGTFNGNISAFRLWVKKVNRV